MGKIRCCSMLLFAVACAAAEVSDNPENSADAVRRAGGEPRQLTPREQKFQSLLDGAMLVGSFTDRRKTRRLTRPKRRLVRRTATP